MEQDLAVSFNVKGSLVDKGFAESSLCGLSVEDPECEICQQKTKYGFLSHIFACMKFHRKNFILFPSAQRLTSLLGVSLAINDESGNKSSRDMTDSDKL